MRPTLTTGSLLAKVSTTAICSSTRKVSRMLLGWNSAKLSAQSPPWSRNAVPAATSASSRLQRRAPRRRTPAAGSCASVRLGPRELGRRPRSAAGASLRTAASCRESSPVPREFRPFCERPRPLRRAAGRCKGYIGYRRRGYRLAPARLFCRQTPPGGRPCPGIEVARRQRLHLRGRGLGVVVDQRRQVRRTPVAGRTRRPRAGRARTCARSARG